MVCGGCKVARFCGRECAAAAWGEHQKSCSKEDGAIKKKEIREIKNVCDFAVKSNKIRLLVDGEYTYMNPGISAVALSMMVAFNQKNAVVCNTYQCYLKVLLLLLHVKTNRIRYII